jgi:hypothetical protein
VLAERRDAGLVKLSQRDTLEAVWSEATRISRYAVRPVLAERRDVGLVKVARTILSERFGAKRQELWTGTAED